MTERGARREQIGRVVWDLVRREGVHQVSVRNVAAEAGMSVGSLRHFFPTQAELLGYSMRLMIDSARARVEARIPTGGDRRRIEKVLEQVLPLDADRRAEVEVWLAFSSLATTNGDLHALHAEHVAAMQELCRAVVGHLAGGLGPAEAQVESDRLQAVIDGLCIRGVTPGSALRPAAIRRTLVRHLDQLAALP